MQNMVVLISSNHLKQACCSVELHSYCGNKHAVIFSNVDRTDQMVSKYEPKSTQMWYWLKKCNLHF